MKAKTVRLDLKKNNQTIFCIQEIQFRLKDTNEGKMMEKDITSKQQPQEIWSDCTDIRCNRL